MVATLRAAQDREQGGEERLTSVVLTSLVRAHRRYYHRICRSRSTLRSRDIPNPSRATPPNAEPESVSSERERAKRQRAPCEWSAL